MKFLGVSNDEWNFIAEEAESLLIDRGIGQHVIGLYPSGNRIFGDINAIPELICIYIDTPHKLLDPFEEHSIEGYHTTQNGHNILFCDLFAWIKKLRDVNQTQNSMVRKFIHLIPSMLAAQYEDEQLSIITSVAADYLEDYGWDFPQIAISKKINDETNIDELINDACYLRARYILKTQNIFAPCININWDTIEILKDISDKTIIEIDEQLIYSMTKGKKDIEKTKLNYYRKYLIDSFSPIIMTESKENKSKLSHLVKNYLLSLL
jgi:hypothetical protein